MKKVVTFLKKNVLILCVCALIIACLFATRQSTSSQTIVINTQRLQKDLQVYQKLIEAKEKYLANEKRAFESEKEVLVQKDKELFKQWEKLPKKGKKSTQKNPLKKQADALRSRIVELQQRYQNKMERAEKSFNKMKIFIHRQAVQQIHQWGEENGYKLIVPKHLVFYAQDSIDKTDEFIKWFNQGKQGKINIPQLEEAE